MMYKSTADIFVRSRDISSVHNTIRRSRDIIVVSPPYSGLTDYLLQVEKYLKSAEQYSQKNVLFIDIKMLKAANAESEFKENLTEAVLSLLSINDLAEWTANQRLLEFFIQLLTLNPQLNMIIILDNIQSFNESVLKDFLENIRVISDSRETNGILMRVTFILGGHSINLRKMDPDNNSPFNIAERIWLDDFASSQAMEIIESHFLGTTHAVSRAVLRYINFLCDGHPYLIDYLCKSLRNIENLTGTSPRKITCNSVDQVVDIICDTGRDPLFRNLEKIFEQLSSDSLKMFENILRGYRYSALKSAPQLDELRLFGLITDSRSAVWRIRNQIFGAFFRKLKRFKKIKYHSIPRRLFANIEAYQILFNLENDIRDFVMAKMIEIYPDKWQKKIGEELISEWAGLKKMEMESGWYASEEFPDIAYSMFPHLKKVILNPGNWGAIFHKYFKPQDIFEGYFMNLESLRNKIAHNRPLTDRDIERLEAIADGFQNCLIDNETLE